MLAMIIGTIYVIKTLPKQGIPKDHIYNMIIFGIIAALLGARIYYVLFRLDHFSGNFIRAFAVWEGGLAIYGGVIAAGFTVWLYCRLKKLDFKICLDALAIPLLFGQALGRWGNFTNAEAFGGPTNNVFAMTIQRGGRFIEMVHPTFFYESMWNLVGVIFLFVWKKYAKFRGELFLTYVAWYGMGRGFIESLRADSLTLGFEWLRISQWLAFLSATAAIAIIILKRIKMKKTDL